jgi:hypothetical protein
MNPFAPADDTGGGIVPAIPHVSLIISCAVATMVEIVGPPISKPASTRSAVIAAAASLALPAIGFPLAPGLAGYQTIRLSEPNQVLPGRTFSAAQHRRTAIIVGGAVFGVPAPFGTTLVGVDLTTQLEIPAI